VCAGEVSVRAQKRGAPTAWETASGIAQAVGACGALGAGGGGGGTLARVPCGSDAGRARACTQGVGPHPARRLLLGQRTGAALVPGCARQATLCQGEELDGEHGRDRRGHRAGQVVATKVEVREGGKNGEGGRDGALQLAER
jgi:hypothetical protein